MNVFQKIGAEYDLYRKPFEKLIVFLQNEIQSINQLKIVELGCGTANYATRIAKLTEQQVDIVDVSKKMLAIAIEKKGINAYCFDCNNVFHLQSNQYSLCFSVNFIHYVKNVNLYFSEVMRILKKGGVSITITHSRDDFNKQVFGKYFPSTVGVEIEKTPDIYKIASSMKKNGFKEVEFFKVEDNIDINYQLVEACLAKVFSSLNEISELELNVGVNKMIEDIKKGVIKGLVCYTIIKGLA